MMRAACHAPSFAARSAGANVGANVGAGASVGASDLAGTPAQASRIAHPRPR